MKNFINKLLISLDKSSIDKIIDDYNTYFKDDGADPQSEKVNIMFEKINKYYKKYALIFSQNVKNKDYEGAINNFPPFLLSSMTCSFMFQKIGAYEAQKEVIDFYMKAIDDTNLVIPPITTKLVQTMKMENLLRVGIINKDSGKGVESFQAHLDTVHDHLYANITKSSPQAIGELALYHFASGNEARALDYLEMQYSKLKDVAKVISCEIVENKGFFNRSNTGKRYEIFVQSFLNTKLSNDLEINLENKSNLKKVKII